MKSCRILAVFVLIFMVAMGTSVWGQQAGCKKSQAIYQCDWPAFRALLDNSHTVAVRNGNMDRFTGVQLKDLAKSLGKTVATEGADLGFEVVPIDSNGVVVGPGDTANAELRIYAKAPMSDRYELVWVERYVGDRDRPWASSVQSLIEQFQDRVKHNR